MATIDDIISRAQQVRDNTAVGSNTAPLVGGVMTDTAEHLQDVEEDVLMFNSITPKDYTDDVSECWLSNMPAGRVCLKFYNNAVFLYSIDSSVRASCSISDGVNNKVYPVKVYTGATTEYPLQTIVGYVVFKDIDDFKTKGTTSQWENINREYCETLSNSPLIMMNVGNDTPNSDVITTNATNATNAINATKATNPVNVVDVKNNHSAFVQELYLFGSGVDTTKTYTITNVARNHSTYKYSIIIMQDNTAVSYLDRVTPQPNNPVLIPERNNSGVFAYAIVRWDEFDDNSNQGSLGITLLPRVFDLRYSPIIQEYLRTEQLSEELNDCQEIIDSFKDTIYTKKTYNREDFKTDRVYTSNVAIGDIVSLPNDNTPISSSSSSGHLTIPVKKGEIIEVRFHSTSNIYCRSYVLLDDSKRILAWANPQSNDGGVGTTVYNTFTSPLVLNMTSDGYCVLQVTQADYSDNEQMSVIHYKSNVTDQSDQSVEICVPDTIYAVVGDTLQLYYSSIFRCVDFSKYAITVVCNIGAQYPRYYEVTPLADNVGTHTLSFIIKDNNNHTLGTKYVNLVVVPIGTSPVNELNVLCLGASATKSGQWASELKRRLVGTGGAPVGSGKTNIQFVGRQNVTFEQKQVNLEATGGYKFTSYTNVNTARYRFDVTAANEPTINIDDVYSNNGNNYTIKEINISAGQGGYFSCEGTGTPQSSGTLTKVSGTGSETITYSSTSFSGNPFVYNGVINMQQYADDYCNPQGAAHGRIDVICTELFGNGTTPYREDFTTRMAEMQTFINQVLNVFPNCKFCIGLFWNPDVRGGMGVNYGATGGWSDAYGIKYSNMNLCNALQKYITDNNLSESVFILNWLNEFDEWNDMQQTTKKVNPRSTVTEIFGVNGIHPATVGYYQMADTAWRLFVAKFCQ